MKSERHSRLGKPSQFGLSGSALKVIAVLSMAADHCAFFFLPHDTQAYEVMRCFGRIAFPVFAFLVAEGFYHTHSRKKYFLTLLAFAIISEVPWLLLNGYCGGHNVMFTLAVGVIALQVFDKLINRKVLAITLITILSLIAERYNFDYGWRGVWMIVVFYMFQLRANPIMDGQSYNFSPLFPLYPFFQVLFAFPLMMHYGTVGALLASAAILLYNGERSFIKGKVAKYAFYAFYPAHLLMICLLV